MTTPANNFINFINVRDYGARGNGRDPDTGAIQAAISACSRQGGGTVYFPPGKYPASALHLTNNMTLFVDAGAALVFLPVFAAYPPVRTRWEGVECSGFSPLVYGYGLSHIRLTGYGTLEGSGEAWWEELDRRRREKRFKPETEQEKRLAALNTGYAEAGSGGGGREMQFLRPPLLQLMHCTHVLIENLTLKNSPFWNTHLVYCRNAALHNVNFFNPPGAPNTDGLDIDSCTGVRISDCHFDTGDDCLCLKSGLDEDGRRVGKPTENVCITNCTMLHGHGGIVFGSETAAGIRNVTVANCIFDGTDRGIRIKSRRGRGGIVEDIRIQNIVMRNILCPVTFNLYYKCGAEPGNTHLFSPLEQPISEKTPVVRNITLSHITARDVKAAAGFFQGLPESPLGQIRLQDFEIELNTQPGNRGGDPDLVHGLAPMKGAGIYYQHARDLNLQDVRIIKAQQRVCLNRKVDAGESGFLPEW